MKISKLMTAAVLLVTLWFTGCKPKDSDIQTSVEEKLKANPETAATTVSVTDAVVTLGGELKSDIAKAESEKTAAAVKGVKSVVNNISLPAPVMEAPVATTPPVIATDDALTSGVNDAIKDFPGVTATVVDGVVTLSGKVSKPDRRAIMTSISSLKPRKIENNLTVK